jgi:hypothetical protein
VPEWLHIGAYPHTFSDSRPLRRRYEIPANEHIRCWPEPKMGLIAMQKVEGSNPFSRFHECPACGRVGFGEGCRNQIEPSPDIAVIVGTNAD